jgi:hypothetical protein
MAEGLDVGVTADGLVRAHLVQFERLAHSDYAGLHFLEPWPCRGAPFLAPRVNTLGVLGGEHLAVLVFVLTAAANLFRAFVLEVFRKVEGHAHGLAQPAPLGFQQNNVYTNVVF